jgi:hypothetical protein
MMVLAEVIWAAGGIVLILAVLATGVWVFQAEDEQDELRPASDVCERRVPCGASIRETAARGRTGEHRPKRQRTACEATPRAARSTHARNR